MKHVIGVVIGLAILTVLADVTLAVEIPSVGGGVDAETKINDIAQKAFKLFGLLIGLAGLFAAARGAWHYTLKQWSEGHSWMVGAGVGLATGSVIVAYIEIFA